MYNGCDWLSEPIKIPNNIYNEEVEEELYKIFLVELYNCDWYYRNKKVIMREQPKCRGKEESFFHIISGKDNPMLSECQTNIDRIARMRWGKEIIINEPCMKSCDCCKGILVWENNRSKSKHIRTKLFHTKFNYLVIIEERKDYWLYITSYRVGNTHKRNEIMKEAHAYICKKRPAT